jgi:hypothetical protein
MPEIQIERKGGNASKITLALDRFAVKLADGLTPEQEAWVIEFAKHVDAEMRPGLTQTLRGTIGISDNRNGSVGFRKNNRERLPAIYSQKYDLPLYPEDK